MFNKKLLLLITAIAFLFSGVQFAQEGEEEKSDSSETSDEEWWNDENWDFEFDFFDHHKSPTVSLSYGVSSVDIKNFSGTFADHNIPEIKLGYTSEDPAWSNEDILEYRFSYLFLSNITTDITGTPSENEIESDIWRFGFGWAEGYGYELGRSAIIPYNSFSLAWSRIDVKNMPADESDAAKLALFDDAFRFGSGAEAGLKIKIIPLINLEVAYERSAVFERHLFWKWAGSALIEAAGNWALEAFVDKIMDSTPYAAPVVGFVLKSAFSYGIYELRKEKMNWPFNSAAPVSIDQIKFGVTFNF